MESSDEVCSICLGKVLSLDEFCKLVLKDFSKRDSLSLNQKETLKCGHVFHHGCLNKWYYDQFVKYHNPLCPLCRSQIYPAPVEKSFPVFWHKKDNELFALDKRAKSKKGFYIVGPYPCTGDVDYGHYQLQIQVGGLTFYGTELCDSFDQNFINKHPHMILALYRRIACPAPSLSRKLLAIGDQVFVVKTGEIINRSSLNS